jgi:CHAT domain-containing protein
MCGEYDVCYSPSVRLYCSAATRHAAQSTVFVAFSTSLDNTSIDEVLQAAAGHPHARVLLNPTVKELVEVFQEPHGLVHIAGHVKIDPIAGVLSGIDTAHGLLTNDDLRALSLRANTLVITGCQTARRTVRPGDEWQGMMREFYLSGVSTIVAGMWNIRDESARRFTSEFYKNDGARDPVGAARAATLSLRDWYSHPYFWAGFATFARKQAA